jgi:hypothetical protein
MKVTLPAAILLAGATLAGAMPSAQAASGNPRLACIAKVLHSEELPFAPLNHWLMRVTLEITPPDGRAYEVAMQDYMPWQAHPPRRGQTFRLRCDPANPTDLHIVH